MIGYDNNSAKAHLGLIELANSLCRVGEPSCGQCPLRTMCKGVRSTPPALFQD
jgi:DNA (cytosine-5)-methyltransferase 1